MIQCAAEVERQQRLITQLGQPSVLAASAKSQHWAHLSASRCALSEAVRSAATSTLIADARRLAASDALNSYREISRDLRRVALAAHSVRLPDTESLRSFAAHAVAAIQPIRAYADAIGQQATLVDKMSRLAAPWVLKDYPAVSVTGFARITRLHDLAEEVEPYAAVASEVYQDELGDPVAFDLKQSPEARESAAVDAGLNPELIAFPRPVYPDVLVAAGFAIRVQPVPEPVSETGDGSGLFDPQHAALLHHLEQRLRNAVETRLEGIAGSAWVKTRVPGDLRTEWQRRRDQDRNQRGDAYPLIQYADLPHLSDIVCRKDNWNEAFALVFGNRHDFQVSLQRLNPVRNAIAHSRPLVRTDQLTLFSEASRLLSALDRKR